MKIMIAIIHRALLPVGLAQVKSFVHMRQIFSHRANKICISLTFYILFKKIIAQLIIWFMTRSSFYYFKRFFY